MRWRQCCATATPRSCATFGGNVADTSDIELLRMTVLADRFVMPRCMSDCCSELECRVASMVGLEDEAAVTAVFKLPPALLENPALQRIVAAATESLLERFGDAEAVCSARHDDDYDLDRRFEMLSIEAVLALLRSDALRARSENSILMTADAWVTGCVGATFGANDLARVANALRLSQLSHTFLYDILPQLPWVQMTGCERDALLRFAAAGLVGERGGDGRTPRQRDLMSCQQLPRAASAWWCAARRAPSVSDSLSIQWTMSGQLLQEQLTLQHGMWRDGREGWKHIHCPRAYFFNGFTIRPFIAFSSVAAQTPQTTPPTARARPNTSHGPKPHPGSSSGNTQCTSAVQSTTLADTAPANDQEGRGTCSYGHEISVRRAIDDTGLKYVSVAYTEMHHVGVIKEHTVADFTWSSPMPLSSTSQVGPTPRWPFFHGVGAPAASDIACWHRYLPGGHLRTCCEVSKCD